MRRIRLTVAYDGTDYCGWQVQNNGATIEGELNTALTQLTGQTVKVIGASRTDAGVHARGNVAVFDTESSIPPERFLYAVNALLPEDIVVVDSCEVAADWHPRHCNTEKTYEYRVLNQKLPDPMRRRDTYFVSFPLDLEKMRKAAGYLEGEHDFKSFCNVHTHVEDTVRTIYRLGSDPGRKCDHIPGQRKRISLQYGAGFLAGTLIGVGRGLIDPEEIPAMLEAKDRQAAGMTVPPQGLTLVKIDYLDGGMES